MRAGQRTTTAPPASGTDAPAAGLLILKKAGDGADACGCCQDAAAQTAAPGQPRLK